MAKQIHSLPLLTLLLAVTSLCYGVRVIDLTHQLKMKESITWPVNPRYNFSILTRGHVEMYNNLWMENNKFAMAEHTGTHMDAPAHVRRQEGGWKIHQIPADKLVGPGVVIDVRDKVKGSDVYEATVGDLQDWESEHGRIPDNAIVLVNFGWARHYPNWNKVFGSRNLKDLNSFRYPTISLEATRWLTTERTILAVGTDTPTLERGVDPAFPEKTLRLHWILLERNIFIVENVANLNSMPPAGTLVVLGALNIHDGSGAPMRLLALADLPAASACTPHRAAPFAVALGVGVMMVLRMI